MAATTTPDGIAYPTLTDQGDDLAVLFANLANSTQTAISALRTAIANNKGITKGIASGTHVEATPSALNIGDTKNVTISFPAGMFTVAPKISITGWNTRLTYGLQAVSTTSMTVQMKNNSNGAGPSANFDWIAVQT